MKINPKYTIPLSILVVLVVWASLFIFNEPKSEKTITISPIPKEKKSSETLIKKTNKKIINVVKSATEEELTTQESLLNILNELRHEAAKSDKKLLHPAAGVSLDDEFFEYRALMAEAIEEDPSLVYALIDAFSLDPNSHFGRQLSAVLSETGLPEVQSAILDIGLGQYHYSDEARSAALFLIADMDEIDGATRDRLVESYSLEQDPELLQYSLIALKTVPSTAEDFTRVNKALTQLTFQEDEHVRRHSVYQLAEWATNNEDLSQVRTLALNDADINTRARAIMSIAKSPIKSDDNKALLTKAIYSNQDSALVRQKALKGLSTYELTSDELYEYDNLSKELDKLIEAEKNR